MIHAKNARTTVSGEERTSVGSQTTQVESIERSNSEPASKRRKVKPKFTQDEIQGYLELFDSRNYNMLMLAIEEKDEDLVDTLIELDFDLGQQGSDGKRAVDLAFYNEMVDIFVKLIEADSPFPENSRIEKIPVQCNALAKLFKERKEFHGFVKIGDNANLKIEIARNFRLKFAYDIDNKSALTYALEQKQFEMFAFLQSQGFSKGIDPFYNKTFADLTAVDKNSIAGFNLKYFQTFTAQHVNLLISKTKIASRMPDRSKSYEEIWKFYNDLDAIPEVSEVLKVVALFKNMTISFDFESFDVQKMHPTQPKESSGVFFDGGYIYIAAGEWQSDRHEVLGVIAHEFTHCAMKKVYNNKTLPYHAADIERSVEFEQIVENTEIIVNFEEDPEKLISIVFDCYKKNHLEAELIVRVPCLLAKYKGNDDRIDHLKLTFLDLFTFYEKKTLPDLSKHFEVLEKVRTLNNEAGLLNLIENEKIEFEFLPTHPCIEASSEDKINILVSNSPIHSIAAMIKQLKEQESFHVTIDLKFLMKQSSRIQELLESNQKLFLLINCTNQFDESQKTLIEFIRNNKNHKIFLVFYDNCETHKLLNDIDENSSNIFNLNHKWQDLTAKYQTRIMQKVVKFHGNSFSVGELLGNVDCPVLKFLPLNEFVGERQLTVKDNTMKSSQFHLERKFFGKTEQDSEEPGADLSCDNVIDRVKRQSFAIITGIAGSGKSTVLREMTKKLKQNCPDRWVSFVDLKQHFDTFESEPHLPFEEFAFQLITTEGDNIKFEREMFKNFYENGKVLLLLDGFDEISPVFKQVISGFLSKFQPKLGNQLWITSRTHLQSHLEKLFGVCAYEILPFDEDEQIEFIVKYWQNDSKASKSDKLLEPCSRSVVKSLNDFLKSYSDSIGNPLLMEIVASICSKKVCGEHALEVTETFDLYSLYEGYFDRIIEIWRHDKGQLAKEEQKQIDKSGNAVLAVHQKLAMKLLFAPKELEELRISVKYDEDIWTKEALARVGLVLCSDNLSDEPQLLHRSFAEFLVAQYFVLNLRSENQSQALKLFFKIVENHKTLMNQFTLNEREVINFSNEQMTDDIVKYFHKTSPQPQRNRTDAEEFDNSKKNIEKIWSRHDSGNLFNKVKEIVKKMLNQVKNGDGCKSFEKYATPSLARTYVTKTRRRTSRGADFSSEKIETGTTTKFTIKVPVADA